MMETKNERNRKNQWVLTDHAALRMRQRGLTMNDIGYAIEYGRRIYSLSALTYFIGKNEVAAMMSRGIDLRSCKNLHVVGILENEKFVILTVFKNESLKRKPGMPLQKRLKPACSAVFSS
jgi:hypothetical protein